MNYANVFGRTQKQFDMTMNREKITVADFFNSNIKYDVFFRRNQRSTMLRVHLFILELSLY